MTEKGFEAFLLGNRYVLEYPGDIWGKYPQEAKEVLVDNLVYSETLHVPLVLGRDSISYDTSPPYLQPYFFQNTAMDLPSCADVDGTKTSQLLRRFMNLKTTFKDQEIKLPNHRLESDPDQSLVSLSFGKDSLLSWAVCRELGLHPQAAYVVEPTLTYEERHKDVLAGRFKAEFGVELQKVKHSLGWLRDGIMEGVGKTELGWGLQTTQYALILLPIANAFRSRYLVFGNEQSCAEYYWDREGFVCYPAYDQCHIWTKQIDSITRQFTQGGVRALSIIEPLNDIAVVYTLYSRYPEVAKYHMSCFVETEAGRDHRWCMDCSVCSKMYLLIKACGFDPSTAGLTRNMLARDMRDYFSLFGGKEVNTYALTGRGRDEQLFAFYLAWRNGDRSDLVLEFQERFLQEAREREDELYETFFGLHTPITIPRELQAPALSIYKEALSEIP